MDAKCQNIQLRFTQNNRLKRAGESRYSTLKG